MKKARIMLCAMALVLVAATAWAEPASVGYVDFQRVMNESEQGKNVKIELEGFVKERGGKIDELARQRDALQAEIEKNQVALSESALRAKVDELKKIEREADRLIQESNEELVNLQREMELSILEELSDIIDELGKEGGYDIIVPIEVVLYAREGSDLTDEVIKRYNKKKGLTPSEK